MSKRKVGFLLVLITIAVVVLTAQNAGNTGTATTAQIAFTANSSASATSAIFRNVGQSAHYLAYCTTTGGAGQENIFLEESFDAVTWITIGSASPQGNTCGILQAGGYYQNVRARIANNTGLTNNAWYQATSGPIGFAAPGTNTNGPASPVLCDSIVTGALTSGTAATVLSPVAGRSNVVCSITLSFDAAAAAGEVDIYRLDTPCAASSPSGVDFRIDTTANTPQTLFFGSNIGQIISASTVNLCGSQTSGTTVRYTLTFASV